MSRSLYLPEGYAPALSLRETQHAIKYIKDVFQQALSIQLMLDRVSAPLIVRKGSGINDDLNGVERKVSFDIKEIDCEAEVVQSLAKWKRMALYRYGYKAGEGIYTDMNAIRRDDDTDNLHSIFVDQWDWEKVIRRDQRTIDFLKETVKCVVKAIVYTKRKVSLRYPQLKGEICEDVFFVTTQELEDMYPDKTPKEREKLIAKEKKTVFIMQIGGKLKSGEKHDGRAPDYDDWSLNGDIFFWNEVLDNAIEISSMGVRVDEKSLASQLKEADAEDRMQYDYHKMIANGTLPLTIGGGIGQSRLCMLLLEKAHIGEVQSSIWPDDMIEKCAEKGITLL
ncbi:aspartate--ammonia ligase [Ruminococcus albus]|uniref:Aspartate--ammonia ligase n=1 Tax=Ruminococcus albus 8 TaxID=246199 RepID=E9SGV0_RUMAL|nr:aspartate--ammonia ligase [Ruminococcus albus]EGC01390.1 aspartate--ammonia ligase [Ruminococcus albus 8]MCC3350951.1 aspartate--ammonia ligase [Ruminococcus albus 8]